MLARDKRTSLLYRNINQGTKTFDSSEEDISIWAGFPPSRNN